jgi:hypothetical protein
LVGFLLPQELKENKGTTGERKGEFHYHRKGHKGPVRAKGRWERMGPRHLVGQVRKSPGRWLWDFFPSSSGLPARDRLLPVELFVEEEDQEVDIYFSSVK